MNTRKILIHMLVASSLLLPAFALAHGGVDDGDGVVDPDGHHAGASALLVPFSGRWWGIMATAIILMSALSFGVWKYLKVETPKSETPAKKEA